VLSEPQLERALQPSLQKLKTCRARRIKYGN
jgi:hypothetical protein